MSTDERLIRLTLVASSQAVILTDMTRSVIEFIDRNHIFQDFSKQKGPIFSVLMEEIKKIYFQLNAEIRIEGE